MASNGEGKTHKVELADKDGSLPLRVVNKKLASSLRKEKASRADAPILDLSGTREIFHEAEVATKAFAVSVEKAAERLGKTSAKMLHHRSVVGTIATLLVLLVASAPLLLAFEAHVINVTATIIMIDPPVISPPGGTYYDPIDITIDDADPDATHIFYTVTPGDDPNSAPDPVCGISAGGPKPIGPFPLSADSVIKAIACDSLLPGGHGSLITYEIYHFITERGSIQGKKCHDLDENEACNDEDFGIEGWRIDLYKNNLLASTTITDVNGLYTFLGLIPGTYRVEEESRDGWIHTTPAAATTTVVVNQISVIDFHNLDTGYECIPLDISFPANLAVQAGGDNLANDDLRLSSDNTINGNARSNHDISANAGANKNVNGDATAVGVIDASIAVSGVTTTGAPSAALPDVMLPTWIAKAQDGGAVNGSFIFPDNTIGLSLGPTEILGDLNFGKLNNAVIRGPVYIHGDLTINASTTISQDPLFANNFVPIIVDGLITIDKGVKFVGSGTKGTILLISTHSGVPGTAGAIEVLANSVSFNMGRAVLYALNGDIHVGKKWTLLAAFAAHGDHSAADNAILLDQNVTVNYQVLPDKISCGFRQPYETTSHVLINEFMPNPLGVNMDQGSAGLPHDGEWVELFNPTSAPIDVAGYVLTDNNVAHELPITTSNTDSGGTLIPSKGFLVVYRDGDADFELNNTGGDAARLFASSGGALVDSHTYTRDVPDGKTFARIPDGSPNWIDPDPTPGEANAYFFKPLKPNSNDIAFIPPDNPPMETEVKMASDEWPNGIPPMHQEAEDMIVGADGTLVRVVMEPEPEPSTEALESNDAASTTPASVLEEEHATEPPDSPALESPPAESGKPDAVAPESPPAATGEPDNPDDTSPPATESAPAQETVSEAPTPAPEATEAVQSTPPAESAPNNDAAVQ